MSYFHIIGCKIVPVLRKAVNVFIRRICLRLCFGRKSVWLTVCWSVLSVKPLIRASWHDRVFVWSKPAGCITISFVWHSSWKASFQIRPILIRCCDWSSTVWWILRGIPVVCVWYSTCELKGEQRMGTVSVSVTVPPVSLSSNTRCVYDICIMIQIIINLILSLRWRALPLVILVYVLTWSDRTVCIHNLTSDLVCLL